jgi:predicted dienelactone hydrolase
MFRLIPLVLAICFVAWPTLAGERAQSKEGPLDVETADGLVLKDPARKKDLPLKAYFPKSGGPYPVIVFSHGFGGDKEAFGTVGKHWASYGYVVIHPTHDDGLGRRDVDSRRAFGDRRAETRPMRLLGGLNDPEKIAGRVADLVLILNNLGELPKLVAGLNGKIDAKSIGVGGHSFGAYTSMLIGGVTVDLGKEKGKTFFDERVKCILPISGQGAGQQGLTEKSWDALKIPMMTITGTRDQGVGGQDFAWRKEPYKFSPAGDKFLVVIDGANHFSFGGGLGLRSSVTTDIVKLCSTHYWDAYLKNSEASKKYLKSDQLVKDAGGKCTFEAK